MDAMKNEELLAVVYLETNTTATLARVLADKVATSDCVLCADALGTVSELKNRLQQAYAAAMELENRARGVKPPPVG